MVWRLKFKLNNIKKDCQLTILFLYFYFAFEALAQLV